MVLADLFGGWVGEELGEEWGLSVGLALVGFQFPLVSFHLHLHFKGS